MRHCDGALTIWYLRNNTDHARKVRLGTSPSLSLWLHVKRRVAILQVDNERLEAQRFFKQG